MPLEPLPKLKDPKRKFTDIDRDTFDQVMAKQKPRLVFKVDNKLGTGKDLLPVELKFERLSDFEPQNVAKQVKGMNDLLELRAKLANLRSSLFGNDKLEELLLEAISQTEAARKAAGEGATEQGSAAETEEKKG
jgi:type VI secretion system protein ImpB